MKYLINKYIDKLCAQNLAEKSDILFLALDADLHSNIPLDKEVLRLSRVFEIMNINTILFSKPKEPYWSIINELIKWKVKSSNEKDKIVPMDCETRTFFHDIPIIDEFSPEEIAKALSRRKSAIIMNKGIVTYGVVTPEQAFVSFSSTCFSTFVKYFFDSMIYFKDCVLNNIEPDMEFVRRFKLIACKIRSSRFKIQKLSSGIPKNEYDVIKMLSEAGKAVVENHLVDSYFGNISYILGDKIYISQTGSSMDELECCIDAVPLNGSSSTGITSSSELSAHKNIYYATGDNAILHGHPKFSVVMSMYCETIDCPHCMNLDYCYRKCKEKRYIAGVPVVSGEIGTGPSGLLNTVPEAMKEGKGAIVFGHGVFTSGKDNFNKPFKMLMDIENKCKEEYFRKVQEFIELNSR
jgi:ribulose-5-phosphate 4-epimerase/fuculose-1-phosphate aldolase